MPVVNALLRSTDIAPSTTQNPCSTGNTCVTATASANPRPVRRLLRTATDRLAKKPDVICAAATVSGISRSDAPVGGSRSPSARAHTGRASAAAAAAMIRPVAPTVAAMVRRLSSSRPSSDRGVVIGRVQDRDDVLPVAPARHRSQLGQRGIQIRAAGRPIGDASNPQHRGAAPQHPHRGLLHVPQRRTGVVADPIGEPLQVVDHPNQRAAARRQPDRPEVGAEKVLPQRVHRRGDVGRGADTVDPVGQRATRLRGVPAQFAVVARRQQEQRGGHAHRERDQPAQQPLADRAGGRACRQHERQQRRPLTGGDRLAEHARERDRHAEHEHQRHRRARRCGATSVPSVIRTAPLMPSPA